MVHGEGLGRKLGFPTANLKVSKGKIPPLGVYSVMVAGPSLESALRAVCNVGVRPTLGLGGRVLVEVHIPGFSADLYGRTLKVMFLKRMRREKNFTSLSALKRQIRQDIRCMFIPLGHRS